MSVCLASLVCSCACPCGKVKSQCVSWSLLLYVIRLLLFVGHTLYNVRRDACTMTCTDHALLHTSLPNQWGRLLTSSDEAPSVSIPVLADSVLSDDLGLFLNF